MTLPGEEAPNPPDLTTDVLRLDLTDVPEFGDKLGAIRTGYCDPIVSRLLELREQDINRAENPKIAEFQRPRSGYPHPNVAQRVEDSFGHGLMLGLITGLQERGLTADVHLALTSMDRDELYRMLYPHPKPQDAEPSAPKAGRPASDINLLVDRIDAAADNGEPVSNYSVYIIPRMGR